MLTSAHLYKYTPDGVVSNQINVKTNSTGIDIHFNKHVDNKGWDKESIEALKQTILKSLWRFGHADELIVTNQSTGQKYVVASVMLHLPAMMNGMKETFECLLKRCDNQQEEIEIGYPVEGILHLIGVNAQKIKKRETGYAQFMVQFGEGLVFNHIAYLNYPVVCRAPKTDENELHYNKMKELCFNLKDFIESHMPLDAWETAKAKNATQINQEQKSKPKRTASKKANTVT